MNQHSGTPIFVIILVTLVVGAAVYVGTRSHQPNLGGAGELQATAATSSTIHVGPGYARTIFSAEQPPHCTNRTITTRASAALYSTNAGVVPDGQNGHPLAASTTLNLDAKLFGCGAVTLYAFSSSTITLTRYGQ